MTAPLTDFQQFVADAEAHRADGTVDPSSQYAKWARDNQGELSRWTAFKTGVLSGALPTPPAMTTPHGRELVDGGMMTEHWEQSVAPAPPPPPPPAPAPAPQWDGAAKQMTVMPTTSGSGNATAVAPQPVPGPWKAYTYMGDDISLAADARFGKVYSVHPPSGHHNPWNTAAPIANTAAQVAVVRPNLLGQEVWYADAIKFLSDGWVAPDWGTIISLGYETIQDDQVTIGCYGSDFMVAQNAGLISVEGSNHYGIRLFPITFDRWIDVVPGVRWSTGSDGWLELWTRTDGGLWVKAWRKDGPTYAYGSTSYTTIDAAMSQCPTVLDKEGLYFGRWNATQVPAPTGKVLLRGLQRYASLADARASLA